MTKKKYLYVRLARKACETLTRGTRWETESYTEGGAINTLDAAAGYAGGQAGL